MSDGKASSKKKLLGPEELQHYYDLMLSEDLLELEIREKDFYLRLSRQKPHVVHAAPVMHAAPAAAPAPAAKPAAAPAPEATPGNSIPSPLAGVFYRAPSPQSDAFVKEGDRVAQNQVLCIVEAMKVMNEIRADRPCV